MDNTTILKIEVLIPDDCIDSLITELQKVGAGKNGNYDSCFTVIPVTNYYRRLDGSDDYLGTKVGELTKRNESKFEFRIKANLLGPVLTAINYVHPFENPIINVIEML